MRRSGQSAGWRGQPLIWWPAALAWLGVTLGLAVNVVAWSAVPADTGGAGGARAGRKAGGRGPGGCAVGRDVAGGRRSRRGQLLAKLARVLPPERRSLDVVVATHPQVNQVSGLFAVFDRDRVGRRLAAPPNDVTDLSRQQRAAAESRGWRWVRRARGY